MRTATGPSGVHIRVRGGQLVPQRLHPEAGTSADAAAGLLPPGNGRALPVYRVAPPVSGPPSDELDAFRRAAVALAGSATGSPEARELATIAADALAAMAAAGDEAGLRSVLRPDPDWEAVAWTVACYQIGDLTPSALRDFADPVEAVATLVRCDNPSHLAAELLVSAEDGLRWTAAVRTGDRCSYQLLAPGTCSDGHDSGRLASVFIRWGLRYEEWAAVPARVAVPRAAPTGEPPQPGRPEPGAPAFAAPPPFPDLGSIESAVVRAVEGVERSIAHFPAEYDRRLERIERRLDEISGTLAALRDGQLGSLTASFAVQLRHDPPSHVDIREASVIDLSTPRP